MKAPAERAPDLLGLNMEQLKRLLDELDRASRDGCGPQRRRSPRLPFRSVDVRVEVLDEKPEDEVAFHVLTRNLSVHGMAFLHEGPLSVGQRLRIEIAFQKDYVVRMQGRVARCCQIRGDVHETGVEFTAVYGDPIISPDAAAERSC